MEDMTCQEKMLKCAYWKTTMPQCPFNPIYRRVNNREETFYIYPTVNISSLEWTTAKRQQMMTTYSGQTKHVKHSDTGKTTPWEQTSKYRVSLGQFIESTTETDLTTSSEQISTYREDMKNSLESTITTSPTMGISTTNPLTLGAIGVTDDGVNMQMDNHDSTGYTVALSLAAGFIGSLLGMVIMLLLYRAHRSRKKSTRKSHDQRVSVFLINNCGQSTSQESSNGELPFRYQHIQIPNTPVTQIPNDYQNSEEVRIPHLTSDCSEIQSTSSNIRRQEICSVFGTIPNQAVCSDAEYIELNDM